MRSDQATWIEAPDIPWNEKEIVFIKIKHASRERVTRGSSEYKVVLITYKRLKVPVDINYTCVIREIAGIYNYLLVGLYYYWIISRARHDTSVLDIATCVHACGS